MQTPSCEPEDMLTGMARGLLSELGDKLARFAETGETEIISLTAMPMTDADRTWLREYLGVGEVQIELQVAGRSEIHETAFPGIWWVRHFGGDKLSSEEIQITNVPEIICTHPADAAAAARALGRAITEIHTNPEGGDNG